MARYDLGFRTLDGTVAFPAAEIRSTSSDKPRILEIGMFQVAAAASALNIGIGVPAALGVGPISPTKMLPEEVADPAAAVLIATQWATKPTIPNAFYRRVGAATGIGNGLIVAFPRGLSIAVSSSVVLWNILANSLLDAYVSIGE
jgi:hypothetical protein